jgi:hypothetical protein
MKRQTEKEGRAKGKNGWMVSGMEGWRDGRVDGWMDEGSSDGLGGRCSQQPPGGARSSCWVDFSVRT